MLISADKMPHTCTIKKRVRTKGSLGGSRDTYTTTQDNVKCWEQGLKHSEKLLYDKRNISATSVFFFAADPGVSEKDVIVRNGRTMEVRSEKLPDASAGLGYYFKVVVEEVSGIHD